MSCRYIVRSCAAADPLFDIKLFAHHSAGTPQVGNTAAHSMHRKKPTRPATSNMVSSVSSTLARWAGTTKGCE